jgi:hypothetical protein
LCFPIIGEFWHPGQEKKEKEKKKGGRCKSHKGPFFLFLLFPFFNLIFLIIKNGHKLPHYDVKKII